MQEVARRFLSLRVINHCIAGTKWCLLHLPRGTSYGYSARGPMG